MPTNILSMVPELREALSVDTSYDAVIIPGVVTRCMKKLLRDYHFPKSIDKMVVNNLPENSQSYTLPAGFKKELLVLFYDPDEDLYGIPLLKREGFALPPRSGESSYYWLEGAKLWTDVKIDSDSAGISLYIWYESMNVSGNESWFVQDFEDVLFAFSMYRLANQLRKKELARYWREIWAEERTSLAIYTNELQFDNSELMQRASASQALQERYPRDN